MGDFILSLLDRFYPEHRPLALLILCVTFLAALAMLSLLAFCLVAILFPAPVAT